VLDEPDTVAQELAVPETMTRATTPEIQEAEETEASLSQGAMGGEARTLELACTSWATTSGIEIDSEGDEEAVTRHTLERGMTWARRAFDELILPTTSVSSLVKILFDFAIFSSYASHSGFVGCRPSSLQVGDVPARCANFAQSGPS
jgi:hypothetical protein